MMATTVPRIARTDDRWFPELPERLEEAVEKFDYTSSPEWGALADLSAATSLDGIVVHPQSAIIENGRWVAPATIYVTLVYDPNSKDRVEFSDAYPARVLFDVVDKSGVEIKSVEPDVSSFYGHDNQDKGEA